MSQVMKVLPNLLVFNCSRFTFFRYASSTSGDLTRSAITPGPDILLQNIKSAPSPEVVLKIVNEHYSIMNSKHTMQALRSLFDLQKCRSSNVSTTEIIGHRDFSKLCKKLKTQAGIIEVNESIEALKVISYMGVPSNSNIIQVLLQLIRQSINSLNLQHIMFLDFLMCQFKSSPLVEALKIALPLVFEIHLPIKMDRSDTTHLAEYLHYASRNNLSTKTVNIIVDALYELREEFDAKTAKSIIWSITDLDSDECIAPLLNKAVNSLLVHIDDLNFTDIESTLSRMVHRYSIRHSYFYNEVFFDTCANYVIDHEIGFKNALYILRKLGRITHTNRYLLDYISKQAFEDPSCVEKADASDIYSIAISVSLTSYRPVHWDNLKTLITKKKNLGSENRKDIIWIRFAAALCLLDIYKIDVLTRALNPDYLSSLFKKGFMSDFANYFCIWQSINLNRPEFVDILPSKYDPEHVTKQMREISEFPLKASLQKGLGSEQYIMNNLLSKNGNQIDHAVLFRKGGFPVAVNVEVKFIEDIDVEAKNELLLILALKAIHYTINSKELKEIMSLSIKTLEHEGYSVIPVNLDVWESLSDFERIPYLMQSIKNKMEIDDSVSETVFGHV